MNPIEIDNRTINFPPSLKDIVIKGDSQSRILTFRIGRYFDGADLSAADISIIFENALKQTGRSAATLKSVEADFILFDWALPSGVSVAEGNVLIAVEFADAARDYIWKTKPAAFNVAGTLTVAYNAAPMSYFAEKAFVAANNNQATSSLLDEHAPVHISNRTIQMPSVTDFVITGDSNSQVLSFVAPRYCENVDLADKVISVKYLNAKGQGDRSGVVNLTVSDDTLSFGWLITSKATVADGTVRFAIEFLGYDERGEFFCWQTTPAQFTVSKGLYVDTEILSPSPSWIQGLLSDQVATEQRLKALEQGGAGNAADRALPVLTFTGGDSLGDWIDKTDERKVMLEYKHGDLYYKAYVKIKPQGTSSLAYPKKNFTINIYEDASFSEKLPLTFVNAWGAQSKYVLKANWIDPTHSCNVVSARLAAKVQDYYGLFENAPNNGLIDGFPVKVVMNGKSQGVYCLMIPKDAWQFGMDKNNPDHIVMCNEDQSGASSFRALADASKWSIEAGPETSETWAKFNRLVSFIKDSSDEDFRQDFSEYLDLDACLNYYALVHYGTAIDNLGKNMLMVTYDGLIWYPSLYDLDSLWGHDPWGVYETSPYRKCPEEYQCSDSLLWEKIVRVYGNELAQRAIELRNEFLVEGNVAGMFEKFIMNIDQRYYDEDLKIWEGYSDKTRTIDTMTKNIYLRFPYSDFSLRNKASAPDYIVGNKLYELEEPFVGDGTSYIDTGVKLYDNPEKEWTIIVNIKNRTITSGEWYYISTFSEIDQWRGFYIRKDNDTQSADRVRVCIGSFNEKIVDTGAGENVTLVIRKVKGVVDIIVNGEYQFTEAPTYELKPFYNNPLLIGTSYNGDNTIKSPNALTVNSLAVYSAAITDATLATMV